MTVKVAMATKAKLVKKLLGKGLWIDVKETHFPDKYHQGYGITAAYKGSVYYADIKVRIPNETIKRALRKSTFFLRSYRDTVLLRLEGRT